jgi:hypothetical protein
MKKSILILAVVSITTSLFAQDKTSFFQSQILGKDKDPAFQAVAVEALGLNLVIGKSEQLVLV